MHLLQSISIWKAQRLMHITDREGLNANHVVQKNLLVTFALQKWVRMGKGLYRVVAG